MPSAIRMSHILMQANAALVETLVKALREVGHAATVTSLPRFLGRPDSPDDPTIDEWLSSRASVAAAQPLKHVETQKMSS